MRLKATLNTVTGPDGNEIPLLPRPWKDMSREEQIELLTKLRSNRERRFESKSATARRTTARSIADVFKEGEEF